MTEQNEIIEIDKTSMLYWYPIAVKGAGELGIAKTLFLELDKVHKDLKIILIRLFCQEPLKENELAILRKFNWICNAMAEQIGYPLFVRNDQASHKHEWRETCYIDTPDKLLHNIQNQIELNIMHELPINAIVFRELIKTKKEFEAFDGMPITKERRYFIENGKVICHHEYWVEEAFKHYKKQLWEEPLKRMNHQGEQEVEYLTKQAERISKLIPEYFSIDFLQDENSKWWLIDMAEGEKSFHIETCQSIKN
jgi:hypothetical protein